uniref:Uncharacterized protein n=1 Tax=Clastoptera arizonana TaxID=38151 RepID=A0A1B6EEB4_9HEMI
MFKKNVELLHKQNIEDQTKGSNKTAMKILSDSEEIGLDKLALKQLWEQMGGCEQVLENKDPGLHEKGYLQTVKGGFGKFLSRIFHPLFYNRNKTNAPEKYPHSIPLVSFERDVMENRKP